MIYGVIGEKEDTYSGLNLASWESVGQLLIRCTSSRPELLAGTSYRMPPDRLSHAGTSLIRRRPF